MCYHRGVGNHGTTNMGSEFLHWGDKRDEDDNHCMGTLGWSFHGIVPGCLYTGKEAQIRYLGPPQAPGGGV